MPSEDQYNEMVQKALEKEIVMKLFLIKINHYYYIILIGWSQTNVPPIKTKKPFLDAKSFDGYPTGKLISLD